MIIEIEKQASIIWLVLAPGYGAPLDSSPWVLTCQCQILILTPRPESEVSVGVAAHSNISCVSAVLLATYCLCHASGHSRSIHVLNENSVKRTGTSTRLHKNYFGLSAVYRQSTDAPSLSFSMQWRVYTRSCTYMIITHIAALSETLQPCECAGQQFCLMIGS